MNVKSRSGKRSSKRSVLDDSNIISIIVARTFVLVWVLCGGLMITIVEGLTIPPGLKLSSRIQLIRNGNGNEESILGRGIWARRDPVISNDTGLTHPLINQNPTLTSNSTTSTIPAAPNSGGSSINLILTAVGAIAAAILGIVIIYKVYTSIAPRGQHPVEWPSADAPREEVSQLVEFIRVGILDGSDAPPHIMHWVINGIDTPFPPPRRRRRRRRPGNENGRTGRSRTRRTGRTIEMDDMDIAPLPPYVADATLDGNHHPVPEDFPPLPPVSVEDLAIASGSGNRAQGSETALFGPGSHSLIGQPIAPVPPLTPTPSSESTPISPRPALRPPLPPLYILPPQFALSMSLSSPTASSSPPSRPSIQSPRLSPLPPTPPPRRSHSPTPSMASTASVASSTVSTTQTSRTVTYSHTPLSPPPRMSMHPR